MKLFARARAPLDAATSLFVEYLLAELLGLVQELQAKGHILMSKPAAEPISNRDSRADSALRSREQVDEAP